MHDEVVLVTGAPALWGPIVSCTRLSAGYRVRTTVRSLAREADVRAMLKVGGAQPAEALSFVAADLLSDAGWPQATVGCDFVLHIASPSPQAPQSTRTN